MVMGRLFKILFFPLVLLLSALMWPLRKRARKRALKKHGWAELHLEGQVFEHRPTPRFPPMVMKLLRQEEPPRVVLTRLRRFTEELAKDDLAKGLLIRIGPLGGGWATADEIRSLIQRVKDSGKEVFVHAANNLGNKEMLIASASTKFFMTPSGTLAAVGAAQPGLFLKNPLERIGVKIEVASKGRFKSAPDRFTRTERSEFDREQGKALIDAVDESLIKSLMDGRLLDREGAIQLIDKSPLIGTEAHEAGYCDALARDEDLPSLVQAHEHQEKAPHFVAAGSYLALCEAAAPLAIGKRRKKIGIVEVHGAIVDRAPTNSNPLMGQLAVERSIIADLRAAQSNKQIGAVVVHVDSRGGSVTASDAIYAAIKRLDQEKPVIACFGDVSASGGYYVACGARKIVCSPLTVTGSIGVFAMLPTWPDLAKMLDIGHDVIKNRKNAGLYNPWSGMSEADMEQAQRNVDSMYDGFISLVAQARDLTKSKVDELAEGRVWIGKDAHENGLVDGLGGMEEALALAREAASMPLDRHPTLVRARGTQKRPGPYEPKSASIDLASALLSRAPSGPVALELMSMLSTAPKGLGFWAYSPWELD